MPRLLKYEKVSDKVYTFECEMKISGYDAKIVTPLRLAKQIEGKRIKVTLEIIDETIK